MNIGLIFLFRNPAQWYRPFPQFYQEQLEQIKLAESLGYDTVWLSEHHFCDDGYSPSLLTIAAAIAAITDRIRIGTNLMVLPLHNAVRVAEDAATVDIISNGRFDLGVGRGYSVQEFAGYGISRSERGSRLREGLDVIKGLWENETFSYSGKHYQLDNARLTPRPVQQPHPPIWVGSHGPKTLDSIAANGFHFLGTGNPAIQQTYDDALARHGRTLDSGQCTHLCWTHVANSFDEAWDNVQDHLHYQYSLYADWLAEAGERQPVAVPPAEAFRHMGNELGILAVGDPDQVAEKILALTAETRTTHLVLGMNIAGLSPEKSRSSIELFARDVMPRLR